MFGACGLVVALASAVAEPSAGSPVVADATPEPDLPGPSQGAIVTAVIVEGARDPDAHASALAVFGIQPGDTLDSGAVRLGIKRVFLTGSWADVQVSAEGAPAGMVLFVRLIPDVLIDDVTLTAPPELPRDRLVTAIELDVGQRFRPERVDEAAVRVRQAMADLGYPRAAVRVHIETVETAGEDARRVGFVVDAGSPVLLRSLIVEGDAHLSRADLEGLLGVEEGRAFDRTRLEAGLERVRALLLRRRHLAARVAVQGLTHDDKRAQADVVVLIDAGPRYRVRYVGNHALSSATLRTVLNESKIEGVGNLPLTRARSAIESAYRLAGYARVAVTVADVPARDDHLDDAGRELLFRVEEGPRAEVTDVIVQGAKAKDGRMLVAEVLSTVALLTPDVGLLQTLDRGDVDDLLSQPTGRGRSQQRPFEVSDESIELLPRPFIGRKPMYIEAAYLEAGRRIADRYRSDGFLDVGVKGPFPEFSEDGRSIVVRYHIDEGERVTVGAVRFIDARPCAVDTSCTSAIPFADLTASFGAEISLTPGLPASFAVVAQARAALERNLQDRGHPFARVTESVERLVGRPELDVVYTVNPGPRVAIGKVRIKGNAVTQEMVVLDRVTLEGGDIYSATEVERSRQRLAHLGLFSSVSIELFDDDPNAGVRDLLVVVKERPHFAVEVGAGASVEDGPRAFLAGEVRNIVGLGLGLRGRGQLNYPRAFYDFLYDPEDPNNPVNRFRRFEDNLLFQYGQFFEGQAVITAELPKVYGMPFDTRLHVDNVVLREIRPAFTLNRFSVLGGIDTQPAAWLHVEPQIEGEISDFACQTLLAADENDPCGSGIARRRDAGYIRQTTYRMVTSVDLRDHPVRPKEGAWLSGVGELGLGSGELRIDGAEATTTIDSDFLKLTAAAVGYVPLARDFVWAVSVRGGNIFGFTSDRGPAYIPLFKRFYLGGTSSIRGFREDELLPADDCRFPAILLAPNPRPCSDDGDDIVESDERPLPRAPSSAAPSLGGTFFVNARSELRIGIIGDLEVGAFVDVGELLDDALAFHPSGLAAGAGVGLRYNTPVGPFAVDLGWKVVDGTRRLAALQSLDRMNLHLSIGYF
jgi:outer membrane protein assembly factor BamA